MPHTPGEWDHSRDGRGGYEINSNVSPNEWSAVAECRPNNLGSRRVGKDEALCNARLIAASLEVFLASKRLLAEYRRNSDYLNVLDAIHGLESAIARAEGRS